MREPAEDSQKLLPLSGVSAVVVMLLGGFVGLVKRTTVPNYALMNQQFFMEGYINEQRDVPAAIPPEPEQREQLGGKREFVGKDSSRRME
jgi:hypothetical protein